MSEEIDPQDFGVSDFSITDGDECGEGHEGHEANPIHRDLWDAATALAEYRCPRGGGGAAALRTESGKILTSVSPQTHHDGTHLCMEVGAILEAHKIAEAVTHSICVARETESAPFGVLTPCGICQERLRWWGPEVEAAITHEGEDLRFLPLAELGPHWWWHRYGVNPSKERGGAE